MLLKIVLRFVQCNKIMIKLMRGVKIVKLLIRAFQSVSFKSGQKMALKAFYFITTLTKYIKRSQRHLLAAIKTIDWKALFQGQNRSLPSTLLMGEQKTFLLFQQATKGESGMSLEDGSMLTKALMKGPAIKNQLDKSNNLLKTREQFSLIEWGNNGRQNQGVKNRANRKLYFGNRLLSKHPFCVT